MPIALTMAAALAAITPTGPGLAPAAARSSVDPARSADATGDQGAATDDAMPSALAQAEATARAKLATLRQQLGEDAAAVTAARLAHARTLMSLGRYGDAEPDVRTALTALIAHLGAQHHLTVSAREMLGVVLTYIGRLDEGEAMLRDALAARTQSGGAQSGLALVSARQLATNLSRQGRYGEAIALLRPVVATQTELHGATASQALGASLDLAGALGRQGAFAEAEGMLRRTIDGLRATKGDQDRLTLSAMLALGDLLNAQRRRAEAVPLFKLVRDGRLATLGERHPSTLIAAERLAQGLAHIGHAANGELLMRQTLANEIAVLGADNPTALAGKAALARILRIEGKFAEAEGLARDVLDRSSQASGANSVGALAAMAALAGDLAAQRRYPEAEALLGKVIAARRAQGADGQGLLVSDLVSLGYTQLHQPPRAALAVAPLREAVALLRHRRANASFSPQDDIEVSRETISQAGIYRLLADADWAAAAAHPADAEALRGEAFAALQDAMDGTVTQSFALAVARSAAQARGAAIGRLADERQVLSDRWRRINDAQTTELATQTSAPEPGIANASETIAAIETRIAAIDAELDRSAPGYFALTRPNPLTEQAARALMRPNEAVLIIVPSNFGTHVFALDDKGLRWTRAAVDRAQLVKVVGALRGELDPVAVARNNRPFSRKLAWELYKALVAPAEPGLAGKSHLLIAADGALAAIPFDVLVTAQPTGSDDDPAAMRGAAWLGDKYALTQLPSLQVLAFLRRFRSQSASTQGHFEGFGNPLLGGAGGSRGGGDGPLTSVAQLAPLPGTETEIRRMAAAMDAGAAQVHLGAGATLAAVDALDLTRVRVLAFATHGLLAGQIAGTDEPGLVLTPPPHPDADDDGYLSASRIARLRLGADLVILSACNSGGGDGNGTPPLSGLARAFFSAGARALLVSHWPVYDDVAPRITVQLVSLRKSDAKLGLDQALQQAVAAIRNDPSDPSLAFPSAWAPFAMVGDWK